MHFLLPKLYERVGVLVSVNLNKFVVVKSDRSLMNLILFNQAQWEEVRGVECGSETTGWSERERQAHMYAIIEFLSVFFYIYDKCIALTKLTHAHSLSQSL